VVSLVLTPMMCATLLKREEERSQNRLFRASEHAFDRMRALYEAGLRWTLRHQRMMLVVTVLTFVASIWLYLVIPKGFVPDQDTGLIGGVTDAAQDVSFERMSELQRKLADAIASDPDVIGVTSFVGVGTENTTINSGRLYINIGAPDRRHSSVVQIMNRIRLAVAGEKEITLHLQPIQDIQIDTRQTRTAYQYVLQDLDENELRTWANKLVDVLRLRHEFADIATDQQEFGQEVMINVNREAAARFGLNMESVDGTLYTAFGQQQIGTIYSPVYQYHIILEVAPEYRDTVAALNSIYITPAAAVAVSRSQSSMWVSPDFSTAGKSVPLAAFVQMEKRLAPLVITHQGQFPAVTISFNLAPGVSLGQALETLHQAQRDVGLPNAIDTNFVGKAAEFSPIMMTTMAAILGALPLAIGTGTGSELRRPLGIAVVGGLLVSQFLTLYTTPVIYLAFARLERRFRGFRWFKRSTGEAAVGEYPKAVDAGVPARDMPA
jgi:multidrug efflux pump subunit AcrB